MASNNDLKNKGKMPSGKGVEYEVPRNGPEIVTSGMTKRLRMNDGDGPLVSNGPRDRKK